MPDRPKSSPILRFSAAVLKKDLAKARDNLSAVVLRDNHLWLGGDEGTSIDRMTRDARGNFGEHTRFELKDILNLPAPAKEEIDIEGLDLDGERPLGRLGDPGVQLGELDGGEADLAC